FFFEERSDRPAAGLASKSAHNVPQPLDAARRRPPACESASSKLRETPLDEAALRLDARQLERAGVRAPRFIVSPEPPAQIRLHRIHELISVELAALEQPVDEHEPGLGTVAHR